MPDVTFVNGRPEMSLEVPDDHDYIQFILQKVDYELTAIFQQLRYQGKHYGTKDQPFFIFTIRSIDGIRLSLT